mgnify:CR=1 FL=1
MMAPIPAKKLAPTITPKAIRKLFIRLDKKSDNSFTALLKSMIKEAYLFRSCKKIHLIVILDFAPDRVIISEVL